MGKIQLKKRWVHHFLFCTIIFELSNFTQRIQCWLLKKRGIFFFFCFLVLGFCRRICHNPLYDVNGILLKIKQMEKFFCFILIHAWPFVKFKGGREEVSRTKRKNNTPMIKLSLWNQEKSWQFVMGNKANIW